MFMLRYLSINSNATWVSSGCCLWTKYLDHVMQSFVRLVVIPIVLLGSSMVVSAQSIPNNTYSTNDLLKGISRFRYEPAPNSNGGGFAAIQMHKGHMIAPGSFDHGGGEFSDNRRSGRIQIFDISNVRSPRVIYDTSNNQSRFYDTKSPHYLGDISELHALPMWGDYMLLPRRKENGYGGFLILDLGPFFKKTGDIAVVGRYTHNGPTTNYDGFPFKLSWQGGKYAYIAMGPQGLHVVDTTDLRSPKLVKTIGASQLGSSTMGSVYTMSNTMIVAHSRVGGTARVVVYDITNPRDPKLLTTIADAKIAYDSHFDGRYLFNNGLTEVGAFDLINPAAPRYLLINQRPDYSRLGAPEYGDAYGNFYITGTVNGFIRYRLNFPNPGASIVDRWFEDGPGDDYAFSSFYGNLAIAASDHSDAVSFIVPHTAQPDIRGPNVTLIKPVDGSTRVAFTMPIAVAFDERVDAGTVNNDTFTVVDAAGRRVNGRVTTVGNRIEFLPDTNFAANTSFEIVMPQNGIKDVFGNGLARQIRSSFSTGNSINRFACRLITSPITSNGTAKLDVEVTGAPSTSLQYQWKFGDGQTTTTSTASTQHLYSKPQRYNVEVNINAGSERCVATAVQIVALPKASSTPAQSATIAYDSTIDGVWNVNPDNDTVSLVNASNMQKAAEISVGEGPWALAFGPGNELWVVNTDSATVSVIDRNARRVTRTITLPAGSSPGGIVFDASASNAYVTLQDLGRLLRISTSSYAVTGTLDVGPHPRAISRTPDNRLLVNRFISSDANGEITVIDVAGFRTLNKVALAYSTGVDVQNFSRGLPNYLGNVAVSPDGTNAMVPGKKDNIQRGKFRDGKDLGHDSTVRSLGVKLRLGATIVESFAERMDFDNLDMATSASYTPDGTLAFFTTLGSSQIVAVNVFNTKDQFTVSSAGDAPLGTVIDPRRNRLYVHNFMSRTMAVLDISEVIKGSGSAVQTIQSLSVVAKEKLSPQVLRGKKLFYDTRDGRLASESYMSCASCHFDGGHDGRTWDFTQFGEGLRNTIELNGRGGGSNLHGIRHWSGNFDEIQDFENQIRALNGGTGFLTAEQFNRTSAPLGARKAGLDSDLDALATYVNSLNEVGKSPYRDSQGDLTAAAKAGQQIFEAKNCANCHAGKAFTDSRINSPIFHNVGTFGSGSGNRLGGAFNGVDTPTLTGLWASAPYLHNGAAATLPDVLSNKAHVGTLSATEVGNLSAYLQQIDDSMTRDDSIDTGIIPGVAYRVVNRASGRVLNVTGGSTVDGAKVVTWSASNVAWEQWKFNEVATNTYSIIARHSGKGLNVEGGANGTNIIQWPYQGEANAQWRAEFTGDGYFVLISVASGQALDENLQNNTVVQYPRHGEYNQQWKLEPVSQAPAIVSGTTYRVVNRSTGRILNVTGGSIQDGVKVVTWPTSNVAWEQWQFNEVATNTYSIIARHSGKGLNVEGGANGTNIIQWPYRGEANAQWRAEFTGDGYFVLTSVASGQALDENLANNSVVQHPLHSEHNQQWKLEPVSSRINTNAVYVIVNRESGRALNVKGGSKVNSASILTWPISNVAWERWRFNEIAPNVYTITSLHSGKSLNIESGKNIVQWPYSSEKHSQWRVEPLAGGYYIFISVDSGQALNEIQQNNNVESHPMHGRNNQQWILRRVDP